MKTDRKTSRLIRCIASAPAAGADRMTKCENVRTTPDTKAADRLAPPSQPLGTP